MKRLLRGAIWNPDEKSVKKPWISSMTILWKCRRDTANYRTYNIFVYIVISVYKFSSLCIFWGGGAFFVVNKRLYSFPSGGRNRVISRQLCSISYGYWDIFRYHNFDISVMPWKTRDIVKSSFSWTFHCIIVPWNRQVLFSWNFHTI